MFQKEFHDFNPILLAGDVKRGKAILQVTETHPLDYIPWKSHSTECGTTFLPQCVSGKIWKRAVTWH